MVAGPFDTPFKLFVTDLFTVSMGIGIGMSMTEETCCALAVDARFAALGLQQALELSGDLRML